MNKSKERTRNSVVRCFLYAGLASKAWAKIVLAYIPLPEMRVVFRSGLYGLPGLGFFALYKCGGPEFFWWAGLLLIYMSAQRLIISTTDQLADRAHSWYAVRTPRFIAWHTRLAELCQERNLPVPAASEVVALYNKGVSPEHAMGTVKRLHKQLSDK